MPRVFVISLATTLMFAIAAVARAQGTSTFNVALGEYNKRNYSQAAQMLERCLATSGANASVAYYCALANIGNKNITRAKQLLQYVITSFPASKEASSANDLLSKLGGASASAATTATPASSGSQVGGVARTVASDEYASLPETAKIKFTRGENGHMDVDAYVNGHLLPSWFDTGANGFMGKNHLIACGIQPPTGPATDHAQGWAGVPVPIWHVPVKVRIGDLTRTLTVAVQDNLEGIKPLFGQDFVSGYKYYIDQAGGTLNLQKNRGSASATASTSINRAYEVPCQKIGKDDYVPLSVGGKTVAVFIDTGASRTILNERDFSKLDLNMPSDAPVLGMSGVGGGFTCREIELDLKLGPINRMGFKVLVGGNASSCVGQDFLEGWRFTVDHDRNVLSFFH